MSSPQERGFRMPAEWEPVEAIWMSWPVAEGLWPGIERSEVEESFHALVRLISRFAVVRLCVSEEDEERLAQRLPEAELFVIATDDVWGRDHGPSFVKSSESVAAIDWVYNGWGGNFPHQLDAQVARKIADAVDVESFSSALVCEGGALESNGSGVLMTTESVLLNENRNPNWTRDQVEAELQKMTGSQEILWLPAGLEKDDTDGHIDMVARFIGEREILAVEPVTPSLLSNWKLLKQEGYEVQPLPFVGEIAEGIEGSYANFLIVNAGIIVPQYHLASDAEALRTVAAAFPSHRVEGFDCRLIGQEGGAVHCLTQGQFKPV